MSLMNVNASMFVRINTLLIDHLNGNQLMWESQSSFIYFFNLVLFKSLFFFFFKLFFPWILF